MNDPATTGPLGFMHRPALIAIGEELAPAAPTDLRATGMDSLVVSHLVLETAYTIPQLSSPPSGQRDVCTCPAQEISEGSPLTTCLESQSRIGSNTTG